LDAPQAVSKPKKWHVEGQPHWSVELQQQMQVHWLNFNPVYGFPA